MTRDSRLVSVILPVFNGADYLSAALESILTQLYRSVEVIVVDDGSTDGSGSIAQEIGSRADDIQFTCIHQANQGAAAARNTGLDAATGHLIAFLDADDQWLPDKLERQVAAAQSSVDVGCVICRMRAVLDSGAEWPSNRNESHYAQEPPAYIPSGLLAHRWVFDRVGGFDPGYRVGEDTDWFFRVRDAGISVVVVPEVLLLRRIRAGSLSSEARPANPEMMRLLRASMQRRRAGGTTAENA
ncbi:MAG: glycosyltransferase family 2 protein [Chloroflexi bacterium]|nr:glycosyltransferase family 2 protein [Chloroflexota bacterium]